MTRTTNRPAAPAPAPTDDGNALEMAAPTFVPWAPTPLERARDRAARRGEVDTPSVGRDEPRAAFARSLRALGLHACANVMIAKAA